MKWPGYCWESAQAVFDFNQEARVAGVVRPQRRIYARAGEEPGGDPGARAQDRTRVVSPEGFCARVDGHRGQDGAANGKGLIGR